MGEKRKCPQCYKDRDPSSFLSERPYAWCAQCRAHYRLPADTRGLKEWRSQHPTDEPLAVRFVLRSQNRKTGPIPVSTTNPATCPPSCSWYGAGCYAEHSYTGHRWRHTARDGLPWDRFCQAVAALPVGQLWRHNEAGDLPGVGEALDYDRLGELVRANRGRRGFTFTHKHDRDGSYGGMYQWANAMGFAINLSCDSLEEVVAKRKLYPNVPITVAVVSNESRKNWKHAGVHYTVCPAQTTERMDCDACRLCAKPHRKTVVAFRAHGQSSASMDKRLVQLGLPLA